MYTLNIEDDQGHKMEVPFGPGMVTLGRSAENTVRLDERNVSRQHARINAQNGTVYIEDTSSSYGVRVNGERINGKVAVFLNDRIQLGDFTLQIFGDQLRHRPEEITQKTSVPKSTSAAEITNTQPMVVAPVGPAPAIAKESKDGKDNHESTAIIRVSEIPGRAKQPSGTISGPNPRLICVKGPFAGKEWPITKSEMVIGRDDECDIPIDHRSMSRQHAKLQFESGKYRIADLKSANGTLVNGEEYAQVEIKRGDIIELGHVKLRLVWPGEPMPAIDRGSSDDDDATSVKFVAGRAARGLGLWMALGAGAIVAVGIIGVVIFSGESKAPPPAPMALPMPAAAPVIVNPAPAESPKSAMQFLEQAHDEANKDNWDATLALLRDGLKAHPGDPQIARAIEQAEAERGAKSTFDAAQSALERGDTTTAKELFGQIAETSRYFARATKALNELKTAKEPHAVAAKLPHVAKPRAAQEPPTKPEPAPAQSLSPHDLAKKFVDQGNQAIMQNHVKEAIDLYNQAVATDPKYAQAQRALGIAHARAGNGEVSIEHYRAYLRLAPTANDAEQVKKIIQVFENGGEE